MKLAINGRYRMTLPAFVMLSTVVYVFLSGDNVTWYAVAAWWLGFLLAMSNEICDRSGQ